MRLEKYVIANDTCKTVHIFPACDCKLMKCD